MAKANPLDGFAVDRAAFRYIAGLTGSRIAYCRSPAAGSPMGHRDRRCRRQVS